MPRESFRRRRVRSDVYLILQIVTLIALVISSVLFYKRLYESYDFNKDPALRAEELSKRRERSWAVAGGTRPSPVPAEFESGMVPGPGAERAPAEGP